MHEKVVSLSEEVDHGKLKILSIGDMITDDEGVEWIVRQCFCEVTDCSGKTLKRLDGKEELDVWDRGRPMA